MRELHSFTPGLGGELMESRTRDAAQSFEGSLMILRKDKNGWVFGFSVHPSEAPSPLLGAPLGTRFQCVMFQIDDDETLIVPEETIRGKKAVSIAGEMCRTEEFMDWASHRFYEYREPEEMKLGNSIDEVECSRLLRSAIGISSRSQLATDTEARDRFRIILREYREYMGEGKDGWDGRR